MAEATDPPPVKLICGMISADKELFRQAAERLAETFGPVDVTSEIMDFDFTRYYDEEMGRPLYRQFVAFERTIRPEVLVEAKLRANALEREIASARRGPARPINLDPGYVETSKLVLASMKNFAHRIYVGRRVYAEITLLYRHGKWEPLEWTFPDFASPRYQPFLTEARDCLRRQIHEE